MSTTTPNGNGARVAPLPLTPASNTPSPSPAGGLMAALLAVQAAAPRVQRDSVNPHFKSRFASLGQIMAEVGPLLCEHGLVWLCLPSTDEHGAPALTYRLAHVPSGEMLEGTMPLMCAKADPQGQGSALTYARRYALTAVLSLVADEDDDDNAAAGRRTQDRQDRAGRELAREIVSTARAGDTAAGSQPAGDDPFDRFDPLPVARAAAPAARPCTAKQRAMIRLRGRDAGLSAGQLADLIKQAAGEQPRGWVDEDAAARWLARALDRLPARLVDDVLEGIARVANDTDVVWS